MRLTRKGYIVSSLLIRSLGRHLAENTEKVSRLLQSEYHGTHAANAAFPLTCACTQVDMHAHTETLGPLHICMKVRVRPIN